MYNQVDGEDGKDGVNQGGPKPDILFHGVPVYFSTVGDLKNGAAFTLPGIGIFINPNARNDIGTLRHEFGHWLVGAAEGVNTFNNFDVPYSFLSALFSKNEIEHQKSWSETRANDASYLFFGRPSDWDFKTYHVSDDVRYGPTPSVFQNFWSQFSQGINQYNNIYKWTPHQ